MKVFSLVAAVALASAASVSAHRSHVQPFGPDLAHQEYSSTSSPSSSFAPLTTAFFSGSASNPAKAATDFVEQRLTSSDYIVKNAYTSKHNGVTHVYFRQVIDGLEVVNGDINVNVDRDGNVISFGNSFYKGDGQHSNSYKGGQRYGKRDLSLVSIKEWRKPEQPAKPEGVVSPQDALASFARFLNVEIPRPEEMDIVPTTSFRADKADVIMTNCPLTATGEVPVDAESGKVLQVIDWVSDATYNVFPMGINDPEEGKRKLVKDPHHIPASPLGWNRQSQNKNFTTTIGNNVYAGENRRNGQDWENNPKPEAKVGKDGELTFDFPIDFDKEPSTYVDAAVTNLFYWNNQVHDVFHHYGFDEEAGNFQENNFGKGGLGNDAVIANAQDGSGYNNANFATPPDGQRGQMRMYVWDITDPMRDGDLESGIIIHEYAHGISTRLTGGPANSGCLGWGEAGGMGEGWGDFFATMFRQKPEHDYESEFPMGAYSASGNGIRRFPYSTSLKTNPETFKIMDQSQYWGVHAKGEVWAGMLYEVYRNLNLRLPFTEEWYTDDKTKYANTLALQLVVDGLKLQPCMPSFIQARDAILQAEEQLTKGEYKCDIWKAFTKRGLGPKAKVIGANFPFGTVRTESFDLPKGC
ncbi:Fungalysin/Thermolysin Extracellular metalloproteinase 5 [Linnemannia gamsii]|uniref:Extracellular metalloproteinase n=1 Tax=Linnemannia gamsii TaxID=64522 RepID=A0ABQ7JXN3_9FUNG|nr:Fungalysin/Thermolysin Extracellular metalloproteinase 5 [Linnemannia gamsii]